MSRQRSPNRDKSFEIYKEYEGKITPKEIAEQLNEKVSNINNWKSQDNWDDKINKVGAPYGNKNACGNKGGRAPKGNINSFKYGKYTSRIPFAIKTIMEELDLEDPLEKLWRSICLQEAQIIYMQDIMYVKDKSDINKELKKSSYGKNSSSEEYLIQFAEDKEANLIRTISTAYNTLSKMIKQYDDMLHANWNTATKEQKLRVQKLKQDIAIVKDKMKSENNPQIKGTSFEDEFSELIDK